MPEIIKLSNGILTVKISTYGAELKSVKIYDREILWNGDTNV